MKKLTKQSLLQQQQQQLTANSPAPPGGSSSTTVQAPSGKKKAKTSSNSFTPHTKSAANSEMHIQMQRYSIGTNNETPLAMNKNYEYFAQTAAGVAAQKSLAINLNVQHKPSHSQLAPNIGLSGSEHHTGGIAAASVKNTNKISTLKNKAAFEKFHPSQQLMMQNNQFDMQTPQHNTMSRGQNSHQSSVATMQSSNTGTMSIAQSTAVISKLSHYQKMSSGNQKRTYVRGSSKKNQHSNNEHGFTANNQISGKMHISSHMIDEKVKKSSSQSLIKMQAAQMIGGAATSQHQQNHLQHNNAHQHFQAGAMVNTAVKDEPRISKQIKAMGGHQTSSKKVIDTKDSGVTGMTSTQQKKLIFSFKKDGGKHKITPPNVSNAAPSKPAVVGHHRRVQSHGQAIHNFNLKTEQPRTKVHSPKVEKTTSHNDMISSHQNSASQIGITDAVSSGKGIPVTQQVLHHPALSKQYKQEYQLNKSKTSGGMSHSSLNGSRDQVSIISLNSFSRSTPKFTQGLSLPQSVMNYQASMSRAGNLPTKLLSPQSQTQVKQNMPNNNNEAPPQGKTITMKEKTNKAATAAANTNSSPAVPNEGIPGTMQQQVDNRGGVKKIGKIQKHSKLRLKHTQSTAQQPTTSIANIAANAMARQASPEIRGNANGRDLQKAQALPTFDLKQMSSRNNATTKSTGSARDRHHNIQTEQQLKQLQTSAGNHNTSQQSQHHIATVSSHQHQPQYQSNTVGRLNTHNSRTNKKDQVFKTHSHQIDSHSKQQQRNNNKIDTIKEELQQLEESTKPQDPNSPNASGTVNLPGSMQQLVHQGTGVESGRAVVAPSSSYKMLTSTAKATGGNHQKSHSYGQHITATSSQPGIYNMYMGQVNQLKKQRLSLNKAGGTSLGGGMMMAANNTQPTHFINLNADHAGNLLNDKASLESLKKNSSLMMQTSKMKMSVTGKAPNKLHLTTPPSQHDEKSQNDLLLQQESTEHDQDNNYEMGANQPRTNSIPASLLQQSDVMAHRQSLKVTQNSMNTNSNGNILMPNSLVSSTQKLQLATPQSGSQLQPMNKNLSLKHKQLAKAIKQQHMIKQTDTSSGVQSMPMTTKGSKQNIIVGDGSDKQPHFINATMSPKNFKGKLKNHSQTMSPPNQNIIVSSNIQAQTNTAVHNKRMSHDTNMHQNGDYLSERKRHYIGRVGGANNQLDPLGVERQKCWQSPGGGRSDSDNDSGKGVLPELDYVHNSNGGVTNIMSQEGGQKSQQISAAIIKKIQNNYQVQVTNGYESSMTTESAKALQSITQRIKNETTSVLPYLHALQEISEIYPNNNPLNTLLSQIHQGISTMILSKEDQIQQSNMHNQNINKIIEEKDELLKQAQEQIQNLEMNENETRRHVQQMTQQIDDRDAKIEKLEQQILGHNKRARLMFKKQMASRAERPQLDLIFDGNCSELERQSDERRKVFQENEELQSAIDELNEDMAYGKQRENKLMFFLYILKQMGYPISEVFEREIKDVPTSRFSKNFDDEYKVMHAQLWKERREAKKEAKLIQQNGFAIDRDEILIEQMPKTDRLVPMSVENAFNKKRYSNNRLPSGEIFENDEDLNFYPLQMGPVAEPRRPVNVPRLNINKVLIIKHRRAKGLSVGGMVNRTDSMDQQSQSSDESLDSRGRPKRCPKPRLHKKILDQYGIQTGARNIMALEAQVFKQRVQELMLKSNSGEMQDEEELRYSLNSYRAESMQSQRI